jgi:hypothetical protein
MISQTVSTLKSHTKLCLVAGATAVIVTLAPTPQPARADLATSIDLVETAMTMLEGIAETGVGIVLVPFGIGFALKIASHVLRAGT